MHSAGQYQTRMKAIELRASVEEIHIVTEYNTFDITGDVDTFLFQVL